MLMGDGFDLFDVAKINECLQNFFYLLDYIWSLITSNFYLSTLLCGLLAVVGIRIMWSMYAIVEKD